MIFNIKLEVFILLNFLYANVETCRLQLLRIRLPGRHLVIFTTPKDTALRTV